MFALLFELYIKMQKPGLASLSACTMLYLHLQWEQHYEMNVWKESARWKIDICVIISVMIVALYSLTKLKFNTFSPRLKG